MVSEGNGCSAADSPANGPVMWLLHITANVHIPIILADTCAEYTVIVNEAHRFRNLTPSGEGAELPAAVCSPPHPPPQSGVHIIILLALLCWIEMKPRLFHLSS